MSEKLPLITRLSNIYIRFFTSRKGVKIGSDSFGNEYYRERSTPAGRRQRRWVIYAGEPDSSKVPPEWHGWLHHTHKEPLPVNSPFRQEWQKPHTRNLSGTLEAYRPPGHPLKGGQRSKATGDYEAWTPS
ncbi:MAG TPA: NADH:ubiquinone oxidoreductase subunit NDUFA12 [Azospirillaceae bacterium]|nr:NADH:ubiquinone oxidoreductase subunit NDUFA12 [Azospirillaceae bacterium]